MLKEELVNAVALASKLDLAQAERAVESVVDAMFKLLKQGRPVLFERAGLQASAPEPTIAQAPFFEPSPDLVKTLIGGRGPIDAAEEVRVRRALAYNLNGYFATVARRLAGSGGSAVMLKGGRFVPQVALALPHALGLRVKRSLPALGQEFTDWLGARPDGYEAPWGKLELRGSDVHLAPPLAGLTDPLAGGLKVVVAPGSIAITQQASAEARLAQKIRSRQRRSRR